jgi:hypothetical protein
MSHTAPWRRFLAEFLGPAPLVGAGLLLALYRASAERRTRWSCRTNSPTRTCSGGDDLTTTTSES